MGCQFMGVWETVLPESGLWKILLKNQLLLVWWSWGKYSLNYSRFWIWRLLKNIFIKISFLGSWKKYSLTISDFWSTNPVMRYNPIEYYPSYCIFFQYFKVFLYTLVFLTRMTDIINDLFTFVFPNKNFLINDS